jgi:DNA-binding NtrC family response regulator
MLEATGPVVVPAALPDFLHEATLTSTPGRVDTNDQTPGPDFASLTRQRLQADTNDIHRELISIAERQIFSEVLKFTEGNLTQAAKRLGITRTTLRARLEALGMATERSAKLEKTTRE